MSDYIKREEALKALREHFTDDSEGIEAESFWNYKIVEEVLRELPTADVVERKKGDWIEKPFVTRERYVDGVIYNCSECGKKATRYTISNYCPNCGAEMRGY